MTRHYSRLHKEQDRSSEARNVQPRTLNSPSPPSPHPLHSLSLGHWPHTYTPHTNTHLVTHCVCHFGAGAASASETGTGVLRERAELRLRRRLRCPQS